MSVGKEANISMKKPVLKNNSIFDQWHYTLYTVGCTQYSSPTDCYMYVYAYCNIAEQQYRMHVPEWSYYSEDPHLHYFSFTR